MTVLSRDLLAQAFPNNPRLRAEFEALDQFLTDAEARITALLAAAEDAAARLSMIEGTASQPFSDILTAISGLPDKAGAIEIVDIDNVAIRGIDSDDDACLVSRGQAISFAGKGATASRPVLSAKRRSIYFDTTLDPDGKPIFWTGTAWVDSGGAVV